MSFRCSWQDFRGWRERGPEAKPAVRFEDFPDKEAAERHKERLQYEGIDACVTPTPAPIARRKRMLFDGAGGKPFCAGWTLKK